MYRAVSDNDQTGLASLKGNARTRSFIAIATFGLGICAKTMNGQGVPPSPSKPMPITGKMAGVISGGGERLDVSHIYSLPELIDFAEAHNPQTRVAWEQAKQRANQVGVAKSAWLPVISISAVFQQSRYRVLFGNAFYQQDATSVLPLINIYYSILDFGRQANIRASEAGLLAADWGFNDTHRQIIYSVAEAFYRLNSAIAQTDAAQATLENAQTVQSSAEARLANGLGTLPDVLEAKAATAQARYELETVRGSQRLARGQLAEAMGVRPTEEIRVQALNGEATPELTESADAFIQRALVTRPDLLAQAAEIQGARARVQEARARYFPNVSLGANAGDQYQRGVQPPTGPVYSTGATWLAKITADWTLFDGKARYNELDQARSAERQEENRLQAEQDRAADEVWAAYTNVQTSLARQEAATELLTASEQSYNAALEAYRYGVKNFLDVVSAQRTLAQARTDQVQSRADVLTNFAQLAFATGDLAVTPNGSSSKH